MRHSGLLSYMDSGIGVGSGPYLGIGPVKTLGEGCVDSGKNAIYIEELGSNGYITFWDQMVFVQENIKKGIFFPFYGTCATKYPYMEVLDTIT